MERIVLPCDLGNGLRLRRSTALDGDCLAEFNARIHGHPHDDPTGKPDPAVGIWTKDLLTKKHPTFGEDDFTIVEDSQTGKVISTLCTISQVWTYAGIPFGVGRPELVGTDPDYRRRGLVRLQMEVVHEWSRQRGEVLQFITGIPNYYRQFGYEMAVNLGAGRQGFEHQVPARDEKNPEKYRLRPAGLEDIPFILSLYTEGCKRSLLAAVRNEAIFHYEFEKSPTNVNRRDLCIIERLEGQPVGFLAHPFNLWDGSLVCTSYELQAGISWLEVSPTVVRYLWEKGQEFAKRDNKPCNAFRLGLGKVHPAYEVIDLPRDLRPYAFYIHVPDVPGFIRLITPVLETRLANSVACGFSGEIKIDFYHDGLRLHFEEGRLVDASKWQAVRGDGAPAAFPGLTFLQLLFGYRSLDELEESFPDCYAWVPSRIILKILFPKLSSDVWPIE